MKETALKSNLSCLEKCASKDLEDVIERIGKFDDPYKRDIMDDLFEIKRKLISVYNNISKPTNIKCVTTCSRCCYFSEKFENGEIVSSCHLSGLATTKESFCSKAETKDSLCWSCKNYAFGCQWSESKGNIPVPGWDAVPTIISGTTPSYYVKGCPKYQSDDKYLDAVGYDEDEDEEGINE